MAAFKGGAWSLPEPKRGGGSAGRSRWQPGQRPPPGRAEPRTEPEPGRPPARRGEGESGGERGGGVWGRPQPALPGAGAARAGHSARPGAAPRPDGSRCLLRGWGGGVKVPFSGGRALSPILCTTVLPSRLPGVTRCVLDHNLRVEKER